MNKDCTTLWSRPFYEAVDPKVTIVGVHKIPRPRWKATPVIITPLPYFDLWYISSGEGEVRIDNQWHTFEAGDLITIKPGSLYQRERTGAHPHHTTFLHLFPFRTARHCLNPILAEVWPVKLSLLHRPEVAELFARLFNEYATRSEENNFLPIKGIALQLLNSIFEELQRTPGEKKPRAYHNLLRAKQLIETNYTHPLKLADIAEHSGLGPSQLSAIFKRQLGYSPIEYLIQVRIREAKLLLARGKHVKEAAYATGFESQHYFSRQFKKKTGLSPSEFASKHTHPSHIKT